MFVRCGRATAVLLTGTKGVPQVIDRRVIPLADPSVPDSIQPFHVFERESGRSAEQLVEKLKKRVAEVALQSIKELMKDYRELGYQPIRAILVVGSKVDPSTLHNEHIRWHALEGQLFRTVVENALAAGKVSSTVLLSAEVFKEGTALFRRKEDDLKQQIKELGRALGSWRAEDKASSMAAWLALAGK